MKSANVLIAENFDIFRQGLKAVLTGCSSLRLLECVKTGEELLHAFRKYPESVCLVSSSIPDFNIHDIMEKLKQIDKTVSVIVISNSTELAHLNQCLKAGIKGYVTKNISAAEFCNIIRAVAEGDEAFSRTVSQLMIGKYTEIAKRPTESGEKKITKREREILKLIVEGYTSAEIANLLYISTRTVETHRSNLMNKLELKNTAALVRYALEKENLS